MTGDPIRVARLNHAVLYVRDLDTSVDFYRRVFGFEEVSRIRNFAAFMRAAGTDNHHDLGLFAVGPDAPRPMRGSTGLYHLAWEVPSIQDLAGAADVLRDAGALGGASDHGVSKSLYGTDPDGNEFEIMWRVPREQWGELESEAIVAPLDLDEEVRRHGSSATGG
jgi:catechol-2,3-dioxygenase